MPHKAVRFFRAAHRMRPTRGWRFALPAVLGAVFISPIASANESPDLKGWQLEFGLDRSPFAFISPATTNVGIETVVLSCNDVGPLQVLQLELYTAGALPLIPAGFAAGDLRTNPHLQLSIDGRIFIVGMFFADDKIVVADETVRRMPAVSVGLFDALTRGNSMKLRFQLLERPAEGKGRGYDGETTVELPEGRGGAALGTFRSCQAGFRERASNAK